MIFVYWTIISAMSKKLRLLVITICHNKLKSLKEDYLKNKLIYIYNCIGYKSRVYLFPGTILTF